MFITFEGIEGVGKTTHIEFMAEQLRERGIPILLTREPGGTSLGEEIRNILLAHHSVAMVPMTELLLMFAARAQHVDELIRPALKEKRWVLCDRFIDATYAYQGGGRGIPLAAIANLEKLILSNLAPDYTFIFDLPPSVGLQRVKKRGNKEDRFEREEIDFFERVRSAYRARAEQDLKRYKMIDATQSLAEIQTILLSFIQELIARGK